MARKNSLLKNIVLATILTLGGVGLIKSIQDNYYESKPGIVYYVNGEKILERRFDTNEEFQEYLNSEQGKREQEYYSNLNKK